MTILSSVEVTILHKENEKKKKARETDWYKLNWIQTVKSKSPSCLFWTGYFHFAIWWASLMSSWKLVYQTPQHLVSIIVQGINFTVIVSWSVRKAYVTLVCKDLTCLRIFKRQYTQWVTLLYETLRTRRSAPDKNILWIKYSNWRPNVRLESFCLIIVR